MADEEQKNAEEQLRSSPKRRLRSSPRRRPSEEAAEEQPAAEETPAEETPAEEPAAEAPAEEAAPAEEEEEAPPRRRLPPRSLGLTRRREADSEAAPRMTRCRSEDPDMPWKAKRRLERSRIPREAGPQLCPRGAGGEATGRPQGAPEAERRRERAGAEAKHQAGTGTPVAERDANAGKLRQGIVVSDKGEKSITAPGSASGSATTTGSPLPSAGSRWEAR